LPALAATGVLALSACSPPDAGMLALTVRDGNLIVLARSCDAPLLDLWITGDGADDGYLDRQSWRLDAPVDGIAEADLGPLEEFTARLDPQVVYACRAWLKGSAGEAAGPAVVAADLTGWGDDVLYPAEGVPLDHATVPVDEFAVAACA